MGVKRKRGDKTLLSHSRPFPLFFLFLGRVSNFYVSFLYEKGEKYAFSFDLREGDEEAKFTGWQTSLFVSNKPIRSGAEQ